MTYSTFFEESLRAMKTQLVRIADRTIKLNNVFGSKVVKENGLEIGEQAKTQRGSSKSTKFWFTGLSFSRHHSTLEVPSYKMLAYHAMNPKSVPMCDCPRR